MDNTQRKQKNKLIEFANEKVDILEVAKMLGIKVYDNANLSIKYHCPFEAILHSDDGQQKTLQFYSDGRGWCFRCQQMYTPVSLWALSHDLTPLKAAKELLDLIGYRRQSTSELWAELEAAKEIRPDRASLGQALMLYLSQATSSWDTRQFDMRIANKLDDCLALLERVNTEDDAKQWLKGTKEIMLDELRKE